MENWLCGRRQVVPYASMLTLDGVSQIAEIIYYSGARINNQSLIK